MSQFQEFSPRLRAAAETLHLEIDAPQENSLLGYLEQLQRWNRTYNLTAVREPERMLVQHLFDSLSVVVPLRKVLYERTESPVIVDVGSGAGLPGVILAIMLPGATVHCVDTVEKKSTFIRHVAGALRLPGLHAHHARVESLPPLGADAVISRAFASLVDFANLSGQHVVRGGHLVAMKGKEPSGEIAELHAATPWRAERIEPLEVPELDAQRCLVWMTQQGIA